jgi:hypothetical protein
MWRDSGWPIPRQSENRSRTLPILTGIGPDRDRSFGFFRLVVYAYDEVEKIRHTEPRKKMDLETSLYAFAWIAGFVIFMLRFGKLYR